MIWALQALVAVLLIGGVLYGMACEMAGRAAAMDREEEKNDQPVCRG